MTDVHAFNNALIAEYRAKDGEVSGVFAGQPLLLLTTTGARSGQPRTVPIVYSTDRERVIVVASKPGAPSHPDWYYNLIANPNVTVELGGNAYGAWATIASGEERDRLFDQHATMMPAFAEYQRNTTRRLPVVILEPMVSKEERATSAV